jgi:hypothetical protein
VISTAVTSGVEGDLLLFLFLLLRLLLRVAFCVVLGEVVG